MMACRCLAVGGWYASSIPSVPATSPAPRPISQPCAPRTTSTPTSGGPPSTPGSGAARTSTTRPLAWTILARCGLRGSRSMRIGSEAAPAPAPPPSSGQARAPTPHRRTGDPGGAHKGTRMAEDRSRAMGRNQGHLVADISVRADGEYRSMRRGRDVCGTGAQCWGARGAGVQVGRTMRT
jgi:hypothetical protein